MQRTVAEQSRVLADDLDFRLQPLQRAAVVEALLGIVGHPRSGAADVEPRPPDVVPDLNGRRL